MVCPVTVRLDLPVLAREIAISGHLQKTSAVIAIVIDDVEGVGRWLVRVLETVPFLGVEVAGRRLIDGFDGDIERHRCRWRRNTCDGDEGVVSGVGFAVGIGRSVESGVVR